MKSTSELLQELDDLVLRLRQLQKEISQRLLNDTTK